MREQAYADPPLPTSNTTIGSGLGTAPLDDADADADGEEDEAALATAAARVGDATPDPDPDPPGNGNGAELGDDDCRERSSRGTVPRGVRARGGSSIALNSMLDDPDSRSTPERYLRIPCGIDAAEGDRPTCSSDSASLNPKSGASLPPHNGIMGAAGWRWNTPLTKCGFALLLLAPPAPANCADAACRTPPSDPVDWPDRVSCSARDGGGWSGGAPVGGSDGGADD